METKKWSKWKFCAAYVCVVLCLKFDVSQLAKCPRSRLFIVVFQIFMPTYSQFVLLLTGYFACANKLNMIIVQFKPNKWKINNFKMIMIIYYLSFNPKFIKWRWRKDMDWHLVIFVAMTTWSLSRTSSPGVNPIVKLSQNLCTLFKADATAKTIVVCDIRGQFLGILVLTCSGCALLCITAARQVRLV